MVEWIEHALDLQSKGQLFYPRRKQLEKIVNLDENSWTPTKIIKKEKPASFRWPSG